MKVFIRKTLHCAVFLAGLAILLLIASKLCLPKGHKKEDGVQDASANAIMQEPEQTIDVLILGDSETYSSMIPLQMWREHGITGYCCGTSAQNLGYSYQFLQKAFERQSPKVVLLETNAFYRDFSLGEAVKYKMDRKFSIFSYHNRWKSIRKGGKRYTQSTIYSDNTKGYVFSDMIAAADATGYMVPSDGQEPLSAKSIAYLEEIVAFCKKKGTKLIFVSTPSVKNWNYNRHNSVLKIAEKLSVEYIDMNVLTEEIPIDWDTDTRDHGDHLNYSGACKVSAYLGNLLCEMEGVKDHRDEPEYEKWNKDLEEFLVLTGENKATASK